MMALWRIRFGSVDFARAITGGAGGQALRGVDLGVEEGEFVAIMGASGSGKSTLLHLCAALDRFEAGSIEVAGERLETMNESQLTLFRRRRIGVVFQQFNLIPTLSAFENIALPLQLDGRDVRGYEGTSASWSDFENWASAGASARCFVGGRAAAGGDCAGAGDGSAGAVCG